MIDVSVYPLLFPYLYSYPYPCNIDCKCLLFVFRRAGESKRFSSYVCSRFVVNRQPLITGHQPQYLNFSKRFCISTNGNKSPHPLPAKTCKSWRSFLICASAVLGGMALLFPSNNKVTRSIEDDRETESEKKLKKWVLLYFDHCNSSPDVGALQLQKLVDAFKILASKQIKIRVWSLSNYPEPAYIYTCLKELDAGSCCIQNPGDDGARDIARVLVNYFEVEEGGDDLVNSSYNMYLMNWSRRFLKHIGARNGADELAEAIMEVVCEADDDEDSSVEDNNPVKEDKS